MQLFLSCCDLPSRCTKRYQNVTRDRVLFKITSFVISDIIPYPVKVSIDELKGQYLIAWARLIEKQ
jgi:hypothetical protein